MCSWDSFVGVRTGRRFQRIYPQISKGTFGAVYKVRDESINMIYAMKLGRREGDKSFEKELAVLNHSTLSPFLPQLIDNGDWDGLPFIIMELLGVDLQKQRPKQGYNFRTMVFIGEETLKGLCFLHQSGFIHGDIKLQNVAVSLHNSRILKIFDFGQSEKYKNEDGSHKPETRLPSGRKGTRCFMSIRQLVHYEGTRKDDFEAWVYTLIYSYQQLNWKFGDGYEGIKERKMQLHRMNDWYFYLLPTVLQELLRSIVGMELFAEPPYEQLRNSLTQGVELAGVSVQQLNWETEPYRTP